MTKILVSIIIPCYNSKKYISKCLNSLVSQQTDFNYEIIVVDSSEDATPKIVKEKFPTVKLILCRKRMYPGGARNIGVKQAKGKILAFIDSDCEAKKDWLYNAVKEIEKGKWIVGGSALNGDSHSLIGIADFLISFSEFLPSISAREVNFMRTYNFICKRKVFDYVGGFLNIPTSEDAIFCHEARKKYKINFEPGVTVTHYNRTTFPKFLKHHYKFGGYAAKVRKKIPLSGYWSVRTPILSILVPFYRLFRMFTTLLRSDFKSFSLFILLLPYILIGISIWGVSYVKYAFKNDNTKIF